MANLNWIMDKTLKKSRIPINQKFVPLDIEKKGEALTEITDEYITNHGENLESYYTQSGDENVSDDQSQDQHTKEGFESFSQILAILFPIALMMVVFAIILVQGILVLDKQMLFS